MSRTILLGSVGEDVRLWETFLTGQGHLKSAVDDTFTQDTDLATRAFQTKWKLAVDGKVGTGTYGKAQTLGFKPLGWVEADTGKTSPLWPPVPAGAKSWTPAERDAALGKFSYVAAPSDANPEGIRILGDWEAKNVVRVEVPQLKTVKGAPASGKVSFHRAGAAQLQALFAAWEQAGLMDRVLTWAGSYNPRFVRGSRSFLSQHSYASAFDINVQWNGLGVRPALLGEKGCVRELVDIAHQHGFWWGGFWGYLSSSGQAGRSDGMHFELSRIL